MQIFARLLPILLGGAVLWDGGWLPWQGSEKSVRGEEYEGAAIALGATNESPRLQSYWNPLAHQSS